MGNAHGYLLYGLTFFKVLSTFAGMDFFEYFQGIFGDRWESLKQAMGGENRPMELKFCDREAYYLDEASWFAANALGVQPGHDVLDMCAAPGGKTLVLASCLAGSGSLQSNDRSPDRRERLKHVVENCLPRDWASVVTVTGYSGDRFGRYRAESFDRILVDAPCSSERHVMESLEHLAIWNPKRIKRLAVEQGALLASGVDALRVGGELVYSTCALADEENDAVVAKILKKRKGQLEILPLEPKFEGTERTEFGVRMLPDLCGGRGPIYCCKMKKIG